MVIILLILIFSNTYFAFASDDNSSWFEPKKIGLLVSSGDLVQLGTHRILGELKGTPLSDDLKVKVGRAAGLNKKSASKLRGLDATKVSYEIRGPLADSSAAKACVDVEDDLSDGEYEEKLRRRRHSDGSAVKDKRGKSVRALCLRRVTGERKNKLADRNDEGCVKRYWRRCDGSGTYYPHVPAIDEFGFGSDVDIFKDGLDEALANVRKTLDAEQAKISKANDLKFSSRNPVAIACGVLGHEGCLKRSIEGTNKCPFCRGSTDLKKAKKPEEGVDCVICGDKIVFDSGGCGASPGSSKRKKQSE